MISRRMDEWKRSGHQPSIERECCRFCGLDTPYSGLRLFGRDLVPFQVIPCTFANEIIWHEYLRQEKIWRRANADAVKRDKGYSDRPVHYFDAVTGRAAIGRLAYDPAKKDHTAYEIR